MPELPEVEIVKQSLAKKIQHKRIKKVIIKNRNLRFKIPLKFEELLQNRIIKKVTRFSKYLILNLLFIDNIVSNARITRSRNSQTIIS